MKRRDSIKTLIISSLASSLVLEGCLSKEKEIIYEKIWKYQYGRTPEEKKRDLELLNKTFFTKNEIKKIKRLANLILPPTPIGNIEKAEVPEFIEFIVKDVPSFQKKLRDGLNWIDDFSKKSFNKYFIESTEIEQKEILDSVAYPKNNKSKEEEFFSTFRDLVVTGYFTSAVGLKDLGYKGNQPNVWEGVPTEILKEHGFSNDKSWESKFIDQSKRNDIAVWDNDGNLIS
ncbi:MAG: gluconate 2-dehydrogenase subunit 3 family protein [Flavobacteriaceae bacterium]|tara:strand:+ start:1151 stop:1840 length:690 start_codon:yes stop_codon:yes gene_type:complete